MQLLIVCVVLIVATNSWADKVQKMADNKVKITREETISIDEYEQECNFHKAQAEELQREIDARTQKYTNMILAEKALYSKCRSEFDNAE